MKSCICLNKINILFCSVHYRVRNLFYYVDIVQYKVTRLFIWMSRIAMLTYSLMFLRCVNKFNDWFEIFSPIQFNKKRGCILVTSCYINFTELSLKKKEGIRPFIYSEPSHMSLSLTVAYTDIYLRQGRQMSHVLTLNKIK